MATILNFLKNRGLLFWIVSGLLIIVIIVASTQLWPVKVRTGTKIVCKFGETIEDNTKVIYRPRAWADNYTFKTKEIICEKHLKAERLYREAQKLLAKGDLQSAKQKLDQVTELDSNYKKSKSQLASINKLASSSSIASNSSSPGNNSGDASKDTDYPEIDITSLFPDPLPGYYSGVIQDNLDGSFSRSYTPKYPKDQEIVQSVLIAIHQWPNDKMARTFVIKSKDAFPLNSKNVSISGNFGYYGTDKYTYSYLSWYESNMAYEIVMHSAQSKPNTLYNRVMDIANLF